MVSRLVSRGRTAHTGSAPKLPLLVAIASPDLLASALEILLPDERDAFAWSGAGVISGRAVTIKCAMCGQQVDEERTRRVLAEEVPHVFKQYGYRTKSVRVCETCLTLLPEEERKARRLARLSVCFWGCLGAAALFGFLGYYWHPLWVVATVLFAGWLVLWLLGWIGLLGWFALDTFGFEIRRKEWPNGR